MRRAMHSCALLGAGWLLAAAPAVDAYEAGSVADGGTLQGRVTFAGTVPTRKIIPTKDAAVCGGPRDEPRVRVGPNQGVQDAVVYLRDVAKGKAWGPAEQAPTLDNKDCSFQPQIQVMRAGEIEIHNSDPVLHNTHGFYGRRTAFNVALPDKGSKVTRELPRPGMVRVECDVHGWMLAHVFVADNPYYAKTGQDGSFTIADIPPGTYTLVTSQSYLGDTEQQVTVKAGETKTADIALKAQ